MLEKLMLSDEEIVILINLDKDTNPIGFQILYETYKEKIIKNLNNKNNFYEFYYNEITDQNLLNLTCGIKEFPILIIKEKFKQIEIIKGIIDI